MKSRICLCNGTVLKKDITRFAPVMLATGLSLLLIGVVLSELNKVDYSVIDYFEPAIVGIYLGSLLGLVSAITLFTYLTKKRECDAIHSLPFSRETLFFTKIITAFLQAAAPFGIFYVFFPGRGGWFYQMVVTLSAWLFNFGLATFAMMLSGRRLAGYILFSVIEGLPGMVYTVVKSLYIPLLPGVYISMRSSELSPTYKMSSLIIHDGKLGEILPMLFFALAGVGFLVAALAAYRKRKLERAGDFLVVKWIEPVFAWILGIYAAIIVIDITGFVNGSIWAGLSVGLTIGYFVARMFFARSIKVFNKKSLAGWLAMVTFMAATLYVTSLDPLGIVNRVPEMDQIESFGLYDNNYVMFTEYNYELSGNNFTTTDPAEINELRQMHKNLLLTNDQDAQGNPAYHNRFFLVYTLKDGSKITRTYYILGSEELKTLKFYMSQPEALLSSADIKEVIDDISELRANGVNGGTIHAEQAFLEIFMEECEAGWMFTPDPKGQSPWDIQFYSEEQGYTVVDIPLTAQRTISWLENYFSKQH